MTTLNNVSFNIGNSATPQDVRDMRQNTWDYHRTYGMPVVHKHRWNMFDVRKGLATKCLYHNLIGYDQDFSRCPYCFGTGIVGGWANGEVVYVTFSDAMQDQIRIGSQGVLMFDRQPQMVAPWIPEMGNGDLIITADFNFDTFEVLEERDRYILKDVQPITIRGYQEKVQTVEYRVQQSSNINRVPDFDIFYDVPIIFDYNDLPLIPGTEGDTSMTQSFAITGIDSSGRTSYVLGLRVFGGGTDTSTARGIRLTADPQDQGDIDVYFPEE